MLLRNRIRLAVVKAKNWLKNEKKKGKHSRIYKTTKFVIKMF